MEPTAPEVLSFRQFTARRSYDVEISHDMLRFPHGISKRQARDNHRVATHHLNEAFRAAQDYAAAVSRGEIRPPSDLELSEERLVGHPDHESVKATWRVRVRRLLRSSQAQTAADAVAVLFDRHMAGGDPWAETLGGGAERAGQIAARLAWMGLAAREAAA